MWCALCCEGQGEDIINCRRYEVREPSVAAKKPGTRVFIIMIRTFNAITASRGIGKRTACRVRREGENDGNPTRTSRRMQLHSSALSLTTLRFEPEFPNYCPASPPVSPNLVWVCQAGTGKAQGNSWGAHGSSCTIPHEAGSRVSSPSTVDPAR